MPLNHDKSAFKNHCLRSVCPSELVILNHEVAPSPFNPFLNDRNTELPSGSSSTKMRT